MSQYTQDCGGWVNENEYGDLNFDGMLTEYNCTVVMTICGECDAILDGCALHHPNEDHEPGCIYSNAGGFYCPHGIPYDLYCPSHPCHNSEQAINIWGAQSLGARASCNEHPCHNALGYDANCLECNPQTVVLCPHMIPAEDCSEHTHHYGIVGVVHSDCPECPGYQPPPPPPPPDPSYTDCPVPNPCPQAVLGGWESNILVCTECQSQWRWGESRYMNCPAHGSAQWVHFTTISNPGCPNTNCPNYGT